MISDPVLTSSYSDRDRVTLVEHAKRGTIEGMYLEVEGQWVVSRSQAEVLLGLRSDGSKTLAQAVADIEEKLDDILFLLRDADDIETAEYPG